MVPTASIDWLVNRVHVGTPDSEVRADIERRCRKAKMPAELVRQCGDYAVERHHKNQQLYGDIMSGRIGGES